jgi:hypothetical protein
MKTRRQTPDMLSAIVLLLALVGSALALGGQASAAETESSTEAAVSAEQQEPDGSVIGRQQKSWWQQRQDRRRARAEEYAERIRRAQQQARQTKAVPSALSRPAALADINVSFKLDPRLTRSLYMGDRWVSPPTYSGVQEKVFTVDARVQGLDANGQSVDITPKWIPEDPEMVTVSPAVGNAVQITVQRAGRTSLKVTSQGFSKILYIKAAPYQGGSMLAEISQ